MHYRMEIIMPPCEDVEAACHEILDRFEDGNEEGYKPFFDYWQIVLNEDGSEMVRRFDELPSDQTAFACIIAGISGPYGNDPATLNPITGLFREIWNQISWQETTWSDGYISEAVAIHNRRLGGYVEDFQKKNAIKGDWLAVRIDYHN